MKEIKDNQGKVLAMVVPHSFSKEGVNFMTPGEYSQQMAFISHPAGKTIAAHRHLPVRREVVNTQEALFIRKGKLRADVYDEGNALAGSFVLEAGDVILLVAGGHGFEVLEPVEMIEIKQGPYINEEYKKLI